MFGKSYRILVVSILMLSLVLVSVRPAAAHGAVPLWYEFHVGHAADEEVSNVTVTLSNLGSCAGAFQIFAGGPTSFWDTPADEDWIGVGSDSGYGTTMWASELMPGTYYVRLGTGADAACPLGVSGAAVDRVEVIDMAPRAEEFVTSSAPASPAVAAIQPINVPTLAADADFLWIEPEKVAIADNPGPALQLAAVADNPGPALQPAAEMDMVPGEWMPVMDNEPHMFKFTVGAVDGHTTSAVAITLHAAPWKGGQFQVFTSGNAPWGTPEADDMMGHSYQAEGGDPAWYGELVPGGYEVRVEAQGAKDCLLAITGEAVKY